METDQEIINKVCGIEVHAIDHFNQEPIDLSNFPPIVDARNTLQKIAVASGLDQDALFDRPEYIRTVDKHVEVLKAAKSLFSKRTLTLYHWMHPNIPKGQLKANVATAWDTLPDNEKQIYISQILGKFGYPQTSLMLNPQLQTLASSIAANANPSSSETKTTSTLSHEVVQYHNINVTSASTRSVLLPQYRRKQASSNQLKSHLIVGGGEISPEDTVYAIECGGPVEGMNMDDQGRIIVTDSYLKNILVPVSMSKRVQNALNSATARSKAIVKRRGRPPGIKKKLLKQECVEERVNETEEEFTDDPELRMELEQFNTALNMQF